MHFRQSPDCGQKDEWSSSDSSTAPDWTVLDVCDVMWSVMRDANDANR